LTLEKPTRGKPVREGDFYYLGASEKFCYSIFIFRNLNDKLISTTVPNLHTGRAKLLKILSRIFCNKLQVCSSISVPPKCCTDVLEIRANFLQNFTINALMVVRLLENRAKTFQKNHTTT
jgi:hypothetical protein